MIHSTSDTTKLHIAAEFLRELSDIYSNQGSEDYPQEVIGLVNRFDEMNLSNDLKEWTKDNEYNRDFTESGWMGITFLAQLVDDIAVKLENQED